MLHYSTAHSYLLV